MATEVIMTADKDKQDEIYRDLKTTGNDLERQAVKFSDVELVKPAGFAEVDGRVVETKPVYRSVWGIAYPKS